MGEARKGGISAPKSLTNGSLVERLMRKGTCENRKKWRRRESNPRPQMVHERVYVRILFFCSRSLDAEEEGFAGPTTRCVSLLIAGKTR